MLTLLHRIDAEGVCGQVQNFKRKITYFYEHHNGTVGSTAGFMKLEIRGDKVKIIINIQEPLGIPYHGAALYLYHEAGEHLSAIEVDQIESIDGVLTYQNRTDWQNIFRTERDLYTFDGVAVVYNDSHYYIGDFKDKDRSGYDVVKKERKATVAQMVPEEEQDFLIEVAGVEKPFVHKEVSPKQIPVKNATSAPVESSEELTIGTDNIEKRDSSMMHSDKVEKQNLSMESSDNMDTTVLCENCPYQKKRMEQQEQVDAFEDMIEKYPKLPLYGVTELFDCVRIHPRDIGKLDMRNWKLGVNSFLTHSFYTYQYLLLGKMRFEDGTHQCIIGVPGVYSNRERYLANMFGFEQFIPVKQTGVKTGEFGYWIVEIVPSL